MYLLLAGAIVWKLLIERRAVVQGEFEGVSDASFDALHNLPDFDKPNPSYSGEPCFRSARNSIGVNKSRVGQPATLIQSALCLSQNLIKTQNHFPGRTLRPNVKRSALTFCQEEFTFSAISRTR